MAPRLAGSHPCIHMDSTLVQGSTFAAEYPKLFKCKSDMEINVTSTSDPLKLDIWVPN